MTLIDPNGWRPLAEHLAQRLQAGESLGDALRSTAALRECRRIMLFKAVQSVCNLSSADAAKLIARELSGVE